MALSQAALDTFNRGARENPRFWSRFGHMPDFTGARVVDLGCGYGRMCVDVARAGAAKVVGIDIVPEYIDFAAENVRQNFPDLAGRIEFKAIRLDDYAEGDFDYFISKDAFEHISDLPGLLAEMKKRLRAGGRIYAGFGPLWHAPHGDHFEARIYLPWGHLIVPESLIVKRWRKLKKPYRSLKDMGMNMMSLADYVRVFERCGLRIVSFRTNRSANPMAKVLSLLAVIPALREYCTFNIFCILEKEADAGAPRGR